ncbi:MAG: hypothetical protein FWD02_04220 [Bacteroidales bacterium]|nr:hypothetical protein [Bacteroidales bacterium]
MKIIKTIFIVFFLLSTLVSQSQAKLDSINSMIEGILAENRLIAVMLGIESIEMPIATVRTIGNVQYVMAVSQVRLNSRGDFESDVYLRIQIGGQEPGSDVIFFGASGIPLTQAGGFAGDISLALLAPYTFNLGQDVSITLLGGLGHEGAVGTSPTRATVNCYGFKELTLSAEIAFSERILRPAGGGTGKVTTQFHTTVADWNDILVDISIPPFEIPGLNDWVFHVQNAVIDLSETRSSPNVVFPQSYLIEYPTAELRNLWKGVYIRELSVSLPSSLTGRHGSSTTIRGSNFLIDRRGFSGTLSASPVFSLNQDSTSTGWPLSMDNLLLEFDRNQLIRGEFSGELLLPVSETPLRYTGMLSLPNNYSLTVAITDSMNFDLWRLASVRLDANSSVRLSYDNSTRQFRGDATLHGTIGMNIGDIAEVQQISFSNMRLSTVQPYFQIESLRYDNTISIANFPASISNIGVTATGSNLSLGFRTTVGLTSTEDNGFGGEVDLTIHSRFERRENGRQRWVYDRVEIGEIALNVSTTAFSLDGRMGIFQDDAVFGTGFYGNLNMQIGALASGFSVGATVVFGRLPDFRYWFADASATFPVGIPIVPALEIHGFSGGIAQRMSPAGAGFTHRFARSGINYVPDQSTSLLIRAGTMLRSQGTDVFTGNLGLEIAFNQHNGIRFINFNGSGQIAANIPGGEDLERINRSLNSIASPEAAEEFHQNETAAGVNSGAISVMADLTMNFENREFTGLFQAYVNTPFMRGVGPNGRMGRVDVFFGQNQWFIHAGRPDNRIGLNLGIGPISVTATTYLMVGHNLPGMPPPPEAVTRILGKSVPNNRNSNDLNLGRGFALGASLDISTGRNTIAIFYSEFSAGIGFDAMLRNMGNTFCVGSSTPVGIRGWYLEGQAFAHLSGEVGLTMRMFGRRREFAILQGAAAVLLQAKLPNPSWFAGDLALQYSILNGMIRGRARISVEVGRLCVFEHRGGHALEGQELISEVMPNDPTMETDVFVSPQAVFNMPIREFRMDESSAMIRAELAEFSLTEGGSPIEIRSTEWDTERFMVRISPEYALPGRSQINGRVRLTFSEQNAAGHWTPVLGENNNPHVETRDITFQTGERPNTIDMRHVRYAYPVPDQQFFLPREHPTGFIYLHQNFGYLFTDPTTIVRGRFRSGSEVIWVNLTWDNPERRITWNQPILSNSTNYIFEIVGLPLDPTVAGGVQTTVAQTSFEDGEEGSHVEVLTNVAGDAGSEGELIILTYSFRTSMFSTFAEKMGQVVITRAGLGTLSTNGNISAIRGNMSSREGFDQADLTGTEHTQGKPLIVVHSAMTDNYFLNAIRPLLYANYPFGGAVRYSREAGQSITPYWAIIRLINYGYGTTVFFPWDHFLTNTYYHDFRAARTQIAACSVARNRYPHVLTSSFPLLPRNSSYVLNFAYTLPNGVITNSSVQKTFVVP